MVLAGGRNLCLRTAQVSPTESLWGGGHETLPIASILDCSNRYVSFRFVAAFSRVYKRNEQAEPVDLAII
jgi:hypothetical protein